MTKNTNTTFVLKLYLYTNFGQVFLTILKYVRYKVIVT